MRIRFQILCSVLHSVAVANHETPRCIKLRNLFPRVAFGRISTTSHRNFEPNKGFFTPGIRARYAIALRIEKKKNRKNGCMLQVCSIHGQFGLGIMAPAANGAAEARKRRKEIIQSQRGDTDASVPANEEPGTDTESKPDKKPPKKRKFDESNRKETEQEKEDRKKAQIRYDPEVPMDKEQLAAWRREARRVRNRESAAASRQRIRNRINELEDEVGQWKSKYSQAMERLAALQQSIKTEEESTPKN